MLIQGLSVMAGITTGWVLQFNNNNCGQNKGDFYAGVSLVTCTVVVSESSSRFFICKVNF